MKKRKVLYVLLAFVSFVIMSGCTPEAHVISNSEDEVTVSAKVSIETTKTEKITEATEATTVYSTKDGITLENAPKLKSDDAPNPADRINQSPMYPVTINGMECTAYAWWGFYQPINEFKDLPRIDFDEIIITLKKDGLYLSGADYSGTINGIEYTSEQQREFISAVEQKYPDYKFPYLDKIDDEPTFALTIDGQEEITVRIKNPVDGDAAGDLTIDIKSMVNSQLHCNYRRTKLQVSGSAVNSSINYSSGSGAEIADLEFRKINSCEIVANVSTPKDGYISNLFSNSKIYNLNFNGGTDNYIRMNIRNMNDDGGAVNITIGGMVASKMVIISENSKFNVYEDAENPNFNSAIECRYSTPTDFENLDMQWEFCTNDFDNTPVSVYVNTDGSGLNAEIQTNGECSLLPTSFLLRAPTDGSVFRLGE
jgi:hypothetical protein